MKFKLDKYFFSLSALLFVSCLFLSSQTLPKLPTASEVITGSLPNGISYYLVKNTSRASYADFALVQKATLGEELSRDALQNLSHFQNESPFQYLSRNGVGYSDFGYLRSNGISSIYHFKDVPVSESTVRDTTLLMLFDICEKNPYEQAIIVSGDIDQDEIKQKMSVFSMMVTPRKKNTHEDAFEWRPSQDLVFHFIQEDGGEDATITISYSSPRLEQEAIGTAQMLVSDLFAEELGTIMCNRVKRAFYSNDIPLADCRFEHMGSADTPYSERYTISITVESGQIEAASYLLSLTLADLKNNGASPLEFALAKDTHLYSSESLMFNPVMTNTQWVDKCSSAFLYGSDLASRKTVSDFFKSRNMAADRELSLFNGYVGALLDADTGLSLKISAPFDNLDRDEYVALLERGRKSQDALKISKVPEMADTMLLRTPKSKVKLKNIAQEPISGGELWTFSNGMRVVFKETPGTGRFSYGFYINGGVAEVPGIEGGEGGFVKDMLFLEDIASMSGEQFRSLLNAHGITASCDVTLSHLGIVGSAPSERFQLLLKSLYAIASERTVNEGAYSYYRKSEKLRLSYARKSSDAIDAVVDSIISPEYGYSLTKLESGLKDDLHHRVEQYFSAQFSKCNDGVFVIIGDLNAEAVKKILSKSLGVFGVGRTSSVRVTGNYPIKMGWSTYTEQASDAGIGDGDPCVAIAITSAMPFTVERYAAFRMASMCLEKRMVNDLAESGMYLEMKSSYEILPMERYNLRITCRAAQESGLPSGLVSEDPLKVLGILRNTLADFISKPVSNAELREMKDVLLVQMKEEFSESGNLIEAVNMRYSVGRDIVAGYAGKVNSVNAQQVERLIKGMNEGAKVEFVLY